MQLLLTDKIVYFLREHPGEKFTALEIASWIFDNYPDECRQKQIRSKAKRISLDSDDALVRQIAAEIGSRRHGIQKKFPKIKTTEDRPRRYYFTESSDSKEIEKTESITQDLTDLSRNGQRVNEESLYLPLREYLESELNVKSMRIDEKRSSNRYGPAGNRWLFPDLVGMEDLSADWHQEIKNCVNVYADIKTKLWSFEVKKLINRSNVREAFFQAVSNSSWANFGYLVANSFDSNSTKELRILSSLHGIGIIRLNIDDLSESQIMIPAKERDNVDWDVANRLTEENMDFLKFIKWVRQCYQTGEVGKIPS